jgi:hypothetical protein
MLPSLQFTLANFVLAYGNAIGRCSPVDRGNYVGIWVKEEDV